MSQNVPGKPINWWNWLLSKIGWIASLNWGHIVVLILAVIGSVSILRRFFGGGGSSSSSTDIYPTERRGFTTRAYTANPKISDFSVPREVYNFRMPSPRIKTGSLTGQIKVNMDKGKKLFVPPTPTSSQAKPNNGPDWAEAQKLFIPKFGETKVSKQPGETEKTPQPFHTNSGPDWNLARKLFVPNFGIRRK